MNHWQGVYPAVTTRFLKDGTLDLDATSKVFDSLINDGVHGLVILGTCGENCSLSADEKRRIMQAAAEVARGRVPVLCGIAEYTTREAIECAQAAEQFGLDGLMVLPAMVYLASDREVVHHFRAVAAATSLPIMVYNNPNSYRIDITVDTMAQLMDLANIVAIKEACEDPRRITDLINRFGDRLAVFCGVDDVALESFMLGARGWVSGLTSAFPAESVALYDLARAGRYQEALELYRWFMPLLHLDAIPTLVQCIKLAEQMCGRGTEFVREPRLTLEGAERERVAKIIETAIQRRPDLSRLAL